MLFSNLLSPFELQGAAGIRSVGRGAVGKIFVNYRRDDERAMAARVQDRLAAIFGEREVFMDVDNLVAGQRFDRELQNALAQTDVFLAVIGPRWSELFLQRQAAGERDYVHEEIAAALKRQVVVIPVLIERTSLPRAAELPEDMRDLVLYQEHTVTHENFGRDVASLVEAISSRARLRRRPDGEERAPRQWITPMAVYWRWIAATVLGLMVVGWIGSHQYGLLVLRGSETLHDCHVAS